MSYKKVISLFLLSFILWKGFFFQAKADSLKSGLSDEAADTMAIARLNSLSEANRNSDLTKSLELAQKALELSLGANWIAGQITSCYNIGKVHEGFGSYDRAFFYFFKGLKIAGSERNKVWQGKFYMSIGNIYNLIEKPQEAIYNYLLAIIYLKETDRNDLLAATYGNIGHTYEDKGLYEIALSYFTRGLSMIRDSSQLIIPYINMGKVYFGMGDWQKALEYEYRALDMIKDPETVLHISVYLILGKIYFEKGDSGLSLMYLKKSNDLALKLKAKGHLKWIYPELITFYVEKNDYKNAFIYQARLKILIDSLNEQQTSRKILELQNQQRNEQAENRLKLLSKENEIKNLKLKRNRNIAVGMGFLVVGIAVFSLFWVRHNKLKEIQKSLQFEQKALRAQMNPHFLFNALNSVQRFIVNNDRENAQEYISKFASLIRSILENSDKTFITINDELETIRLYLEIEQMRMRDKLHFTIEVDASIDTYNHYIPTMLIQPYVENAIWHGIVNKKSVGMVKIEVRDVNENFLFRIEDDGIGRKQSMEVNRLKKQYYNSSGMRLSSERVKTLNVFAKDKIKITVLDLENEEGLAAGTAVEILIPKNLG